MAANMMSMRMTASTASASVRTARASPSASCHAAFRRVVALAPAAPRGRSSLTVRVAAQAAAGAATPSKVKMVIQGRKLQVTDAIKSYVESKISRALANFGQEVKEVDVTLSARGGDTGTHGKKEQKVEVTVYTVRNGIVRVEDSEGTLYASIDVVADKVERKMVKIKERAIVKGKWPGRAGPRDVASEEQSFKEYKEEVAYETAVFDREEKLARQFAELNKEFPATVRRTKIIELDPMSVDEAIEAMEAIGHDFYVFREMESDTVQVVYRRESEGYGVLIPAMRQ